MILRGSLITLKISFGRELGVRPRGEALSEEWIM